MATLCCTAVLWLVACVASAMLAPRPFTGPASVIRNLRQLRLATLCLPTVSAPRSYAWRCSVMWPSTDSIACGRPKPAPQRQPSANLRSSREQDRTTVGKRAEWDTGFLKTPRQIRFIALQNPIFPGKRARLLG